MRKLFLFLTVALGTLGVHADEGMWMLNKVDARTAQVMKELGLQLTTQELYNPDGVSLKDAVVDFGDFCSGVVVSPEGLVFTNHHCGFSSIQKLSTPEDDILKNGFVSHSRNEERPVEGLFVRFLERTEDCTGRVMRAMNGLPNNQLDSVMTAVENEYQEQNPGKQVLVKSYYNGNAFYVSIYQTYNDIRLVFSAPQTLGKFGGDTDNWMWPRQTCDFSVFRIYADKDGQPADYSADNVPLQVKRYASISLNGYEPGDYCMTIGFPGSTSRYLSSYGINERINAQNVAFIDVRGLKQDIWKRHMNADRAVAIQYASKFASSSNYWKNSIGMNKAIKDLNVIGLKQGIEADLKAWYEGDADLTRRFSQMLPELERDYKARFESMRASYFFSETFVRGIELYRLASIVRDTIQDTREERLATFRKDYDPSVDREVMAALLNNYRQKVDTAFLPSIYQEIDANYKGDCEAYANALFAPLTQELLDNPDSTAWQPILAYAKSIDDCREQMQSDDNRRLSENIAYNEHLLTQAILEHDQESAHYSDANFSMRLSFGYVQDYTSEGQHFDYYTSSQSIIDKAARQEEIADYKLESDIVDLLKAKNFGRYADKRTNDLQLCFLSNNDITGGNSGSPMFNGKGQLLGLAFDGNWEAMSGDISFNDDLQRCIGVDIRYVLFIIEKWGKADNLIKELTLVAD